MSKDNSTNMDISYLEKNADWAILVFFTVTVAITVTINIGWYNFVGHWRHFYQAVHSTPRFLG